MAEAVRIEGLKETQRRLKTLGQVEESKELRVGLKAAADIVAVEAKGNVPSRTGRAAGSIRAGATGQKAYVAGGKKSVPYYAWLDFGTRRPRRGNRRSVGPWAGSGKGPKHGRFIYAALDAKRDQVVAKVREAVIKLENGAGFQ